MRLRTFNERLLPMAPEGAAVATMGDFRGLWGPAVEPVDQPKPQRLDFIRLRLAMLPYTLSGCPATRELATRIAFGRLGPRELDRLDELVDAIDEGAA